MVRKGHWETNRKLQSPGSLSKQTATTHCSGLLFRNCPLSSNERLSTSTVVQLEITIAYLTGAE